MGVACPAASVPDLINGIICPVWNNFSLYWHLPMLGMSVVILTFYSKDESGAKLFVLSLIWPAGYFLFMRLHMIFFEYVPVPDFVFGFHIMQLPVIIIPALFLFAVITEVSEQFTGRIE